MFEVRDSNNEVLYKNESFLSCRVRADEAAKAPVPTGAPFNVFEVKQVYTTQTLEEAIMDTIDPDYADSFERNK